ncbi:MAG: hypothetical protein FJY97_18805 [candidate division Zixibacteria bacterium]|nr:hypothetical protein [candidate division Zixibacteria bacterium]
MSKAGVFTFREIVNTNEELQEELRNGGSLIALAARYRIVITPEDVRGAMEEMEGEMEDEERGWYETAASGA